jgi:hypothetical protein
MSDHPRTAKEVIEVVDGLRALRDRDVAGVLVTAAVLVPSTKLLVGRALFSDELIDPRPNCKYATVQLLEEWLPKLRIMSWLRDALDGAMRLGGESVATALSGSNVERRIAGRYNATGWSHHAIACTLDVTRSSTSGEAVVHRSLPPYPNLESAAREWVLGDTHRVSHGLAYEGQLVVVMPDTRGRILDAVWRDDTVHVRVESRMPSGAIELQALFDGSTQQRHAFSSDLASKVIFNVPIDTRLVSLFLVTAGDLLGQVDLTRVRPAWGQQPEQHEHLQQTERDLNSGEGQEVEFKPFVQAADDKETELVKTVVAFANSNGGRLYVGVDKHGDLQGQPALRDAFGKPAGALDRARKRLKQLLSDKIKPASPVEIETMTIHGEPLLVVRVVGRSGEYYSTQSNEVFVRKGATSMRADAHTELPDIVAASKRLLP